MAEQNGVVEKPKEAIDTGYQIDNDDLIRGPTYDGKFWIDGDLIWGPFNAGKYHLEANIVLGADNKPTGFFIQDDKIYGPSRELPWFKK